MNTFQFTSDAVSLRREDALIGRNQVRQAVERAFADRVLESA